MEESEHFKKKVGRKSHEEGVIPLNARKLRKKDYPLFFEALRLSSGMITSACKKIGITRELVYQRIDQDPDFKAGVEQCRESVKDFGEAALLKKIQEGDTAAIIFYAKTQLKDRGYTERHEIVGKDGEPIKTDNMNKTILTQMTPEEIDNEIARLDKLNDTTEG